MKKLLFLLTVLLFNSCAFIDTPVTAQPGPRVILYNGYYYPYSYYYYPNVNIYAPYNSRPWPYYYNNYHYNRPRPNPIGRPNIHYGPRPQRPNRPRR